MKTAILIHGRPDKDEYYDEHVPTQSNSHWFPWLTKQLQIRDIFAVAIEMPIPWKPNYAIWKRELERFDITHETILIGHSCGGGFIIRWLSERKDIRVGKIILVAPWLNPEDNPRSETGDFFHFTIDSDLITRTRGITIFNSDNDKPTIHRSVQIIRNKFPSALYRELHNCGHFCEEDMGTTRFPELLSEIITC